MMKLKPGVAASHASSLLSNDEHPALATTAAVVVGTKLAEAPRIVPERVEVVGLPELPVPTLASLLELPGVSGSILEIH